MKSFFPTAVKPPKLVKSYGPTLGYVATGISIVFALVHLFRIDTLLPIIVDTLGSNIAGTYVVVVIVAEIFAVPFLLRMKLSPAAHVVSGFLAVLAPLMWALLSIWSFGMSTPTGQLGEFVSLPSSLPLIALDILWTVFSFVTIWSLGYNNLSFRPVSKAKASASRRS